MSCLHRRRDREIPWRRAAWLVMDASLWRHEAFRNVAQHSYCKRAVRLSIALPTGRMHMRLIGGVAPGSLLKRWCSDHHHGADNSSLCFIARHISCTRDIVIGSTTKRGMNNQVIPVFRKPLVSVHRKKPAANKMCILSYCWAKDRVWGHYLTAYHSSGRKASDVRRTVAAESPLHCV